MYEIRVRTTGAQMSYILTPKLRCGYQKKKSALKRRSRFAFLVKKSVLGPDDEYRVEESVIVFIIKQHVIREEEITENYMI